jgi:hypothetical protein
LGASSTLLVSPAGSTCFFPHMLFPEPPTDTAALFLFRHQSHSGSACPLSLKTYVRFIRYTTTLRTSSPLLLRILFSTSSSQPQPLARPTVPTVLGALADFVRYFVTPRTELTKASSKDRPTARVHKLVPSLKDQTVHLPTVASNHASPLTEPAELTPVHASIDPRSFLAHAGPRDGAASLTSAAHA